ncbi:MAG TPA: hypothetical protein VN702_02355 [Acetobacteraceae bacterium]|nr:hypothetical protein [Acetobacteraceae bacterium]
MALAFAMRLRMAAAALGCASLREFSARFREAPPATQCDLNWFNEWVLGRSPPRAPSVYAEMRWIVSATGTSDPVFVTIQVPQHSMP